MQGESNTDVNFYIKKLDNHAVRLAHSLYSRKAFFQGCFFSWFFCEFFI